MGMRTEVNWSEFLGYSGKYLANAWDAAMSSDTQTAGQWVDDLILDALMNMVRMDAAADGELHIEDIVMYRNVYERLACLQEIVWSLIREVQ